VTLLGTHQIGLDYRDDLIMHHTETLPFHANGMRFTAYDEQGEALQTRVYYSVGGGFVVDESASDGDVVVDDPTPVRYPFSTAEELLAQCEEHGLSISSLMLANELAWRSEAEIRTGLLALWEIMQACIDRGCRTEGIMPGGLKVKRRAAQLQRQLKSQGESLGAEVGCQGEVGSACSMAAGALADALGGTPAQVENAAEIAMEHNLGLTCDPIGGLVPVPCI